VLLLLLEGIAQPLGNMQRLGPLQLQMLDFCRKYPGRHTISPDRDTVRVARSLQRRGLLHVTDCGMSTASGQPVLMVCLP
jgi:hypothetical protein